VMKCTARSIRRLVLSLMPAAILASTQDTTAFVMTFPTDDDRMLVKPFRIPTGRQRIWSIQTPEARTRLHIKRGRMLASCPDAGDVIDFDRVRKSLLSNPSSTTCGKFKMDPHAASSIAAKLQSAGSMSSMCPRVVLISGVARRLRR